MNFHFLKKNYESKRMKQLVTVRNAWRIKKKRRFALY